MQKLVLHHYLCPGDVLMLTAAIRDLHDCYPNEYITDVRTSCMEIWENNPYITKISDDDKEAKHIQAEYPLVHESNQRSHHFIHGFVYFLNDELKLNIKPGEFKPEIYLSDSEKGWYSQIYEIVGKDIPYWIINAGCKQDYTAKAWEFDRFQQVVKMLKDITFVQIGEKSHMHKDLVGDNVINLIGKTDFRQLVRLIYHSAGVITGVSLPMHLAAAIEVKSCYKRKTRPCVVIAGGREATVWEAYTNHAFLHTCGMLPCCDYGGCWKSRVEPLGDGDEKDTNLCERPVKTKSGQVIPMCMNMITPQDVMMKIRNYLMTYNFYKDWEYNKDNSVKS